MNLQAKLTLGYVLLAVAIVSIISGIDLTTNMQQQFEGTLERAEVLSPVATKFVRQTLNSQLSVPLRTALREQSLATDLLDLLTKSPTILEIAVVDAKTDEVLADSDPGRLGSKCGPYEDFRDFVTRSGWWDKLKVLLPNAPHYYQLDR